MNYSRARSTQRVRFEHGLGDCVHFAHQLPLYLRRGFDIEVCCRRNKAILFEAAGVRVVEDRRGAATVRWFEGEEPTEDLRHDNYWYWSKLARNLSLPPMPDLGNPRFLWDEYCDVALTIEDLIPTAVRRSIEAYLDGLPRPVVMLHSHGATDRSRKDIPPAVLREVYRELLAVSPGTIVLLDDDPDLPTTPHWRIRRVRDDYGPIDIPELAALLSRADLIIGVDSGPLHLGRYTATPAIGVWMGDGSPATWALPRARQANIVVGQRSRCWVGQARLPFNIVDCSRPEALAETVGRTTQRMLGGPRYIPRTAIGRDVLLQHLVRDRQDASDNSFGGFDDRDQGYDFLLREASSQFEHPFIVEAGAMCETDQAVDAGQSTLVLGLFAAGHGGALTSVDDDAGSVAFARAAVGALGDSVEVVHSNSVGWLTANCQAIDVLNLDACQAREPGGAVQALQEVQAAFASLHSSSLIVLDDACYLNGGFIGSGALAVPWLLERGWRVLFSGCQTILSPTKR